MTGPVFVDTNAVAGGCIVMNRETPTREIAKARREQRRSCVSAGLGYQESAGNPRVTAGQGAMLFL